MTTFLIIKCYIYSSTAVDAVFKITSNENGANA